MNTKQGLLIALVGCMVAAPTMASNVTYDVQGTYSDGGTFSGSFSYDPITNSYTDPPNSFGQFDVTTFGGTSGIPSRPFGAFEASNAGADDFGSTPTQFGLVSGQSAGAPFTSFALVLTWNSPLNAADGNTTQPITGGYEKYSAYQPDGTVVASGERDVVSGFVEPVPLLPAIWLMLSALGGLGVTVRRLSVDSASAYARATRQAI
jgi:hypothetical protein